jgi:nucleoside-diphosphate-sugar epimerase
MSDWPGDLGIDWRQFHGNHFEGKRALVTGGAGFIGSHLTDALCSLGAHVVVLDDLSGGSWENLVASPAARLVDGSVLDTQTLAECTTGCQYLFHQAALGSVPASVEDPARYHAVNSTGTLNVLEAARAAGVRRVLFAASSSAYGDNPVPWAESMPVLPKSPYAATKVAAEALLRAYAGSYGSPDTVSLRYFNIFGPRQNANSAYAAVIAAFAKAMIGGQRPVIYGDGEQSRDFTFVANAVHANLLAARPDREFAGEVINVGCGVPITVNHLARVMAQELGGEQQPAEHAPPRAGDLKHSFADLSRAERLLAYSPIVSFEQGLERTLDWYVRQ